jgi:hypothetical protein
MLPQAPVLLLLLRHAVPAAEQLSTAAVLLLLPHLRLGWRALPAQAVLQ